MNDESMEKFADIVISEMMRSAVEYLQSKGMTKDAMMSKVDDLLKEIRNRVPDALHEALEDFKEAHEIRMDRIGETSAILSFRLAGIEAAKAVVG